ncbi:glycosyltransferase family 4 protein [Flindersiella endophytica]
MRIGIDAYVTAPHHGGFISYISHIAENLAASGKDEILLYAPSTSPVELSLRNVSPRPVGFDLAGYPERLERDITWHQQALFSALETDQPDVLLGTSFFLPLRWQRPMVVTVHDVIFEHHPEYFTAANLELYQVWGRRSAERADAILTVSESTAKEVEVAWDLRDKPIVPAPLGHSLGFLPASREESKRIVAGQVFEGTVTDYVLSVAAGHRRKNLPGLLEAYALLPASLRRANPLLLVNLDIERTHRLVADQGLSDDVRITGRLPDELIPHVYTAARMLVHPSFYEGFGIPVLEAMACGTPVVSSIRPAIPEVTGDAALLVDPDDTSAIVEAMTRVLTDRGLAESLGAAGRIRSRAFDWATTTRITRDVLAAAAAA